MTNSAQLLILGNGFDRRCGLASDYKTFFKTAILDCSTAESALPKLRAECNGFWECLLFEYHKKYVIAAIITGAILKGLLKTHYLLYALTRKHHKKII